MNDISRVCYVPANDPPSENDLQKWIANGNVLNLNWVIVSSLWS